MVRLPRIVALLGGRNLPPGTRRALLRDVGGPLRGQDRLPFAVSLGACAD